MRSRLRAERGQTSVEYLGVIVVVAVIVAGLLTASPGVSNALGSGLRRAVCLIVGHDSCPDAAVPKPKRHGSGGPLGFVKARAGDVADAAKATGGFVGDVGVGAYDRVKGTLPLPLWKRVLKAAAAPVAGIGTFLGCEALTGVETLGGSTVGCAAAGGAVYGAVRGAQTCHGSLTCTVTHTAIGGAGGAVFGGVAMAAAPLGPVLSNALAGGASSLTVTMGDQATTGRFDVRQLVINTAVGAVLGGVGGKLADSLGGSATPESAIPQGFASSTEFSTFSGQLHSGLSEAGFANTQAAFQGSSVTGQSFGTGVRFDVGRVSDFDIALGGEDIFGAAQAAGIRLRAGGIRTGPLTRLDIDRLGLTGLRADLNELAGRRVNFMVYRSIEDALARSPGIMVP
jgi:hypothetical protein